ncbi:hypothetical protein [Actinophytocola sp. NPDC049390]|uniref:hypothetical protein n=1 Tax=Actinophytocola sp. NPDC049390 TaxID=3363894 RepID=UPI0037895A75
MHTPEMTQAERELDGRIEHALRVAGRVREQLTSLDRKAVPVSDEDVERVRAFVLGHAHTDEWRPVLDRIDRGELTWRQVVEALATGNADRAVATAFDSLPKATPATVEKLVEIGVFPAHLPEPPPVEAPRPPVDEDEFFDNPLRLRRR